MFESLIADPVGITSIRTVADELRDESPVAVEFEAHYDVGSTRVKNVDRRPDAMLDPSRWSSQTIRLNSIEHATD